MYEKKLKKKKNIEGMILMYIGYERKAFTHITYTSVDNSIIVCIKIIGKLWVVWVQ